MEESFVEKLAASEAVQVAALEALRLEVASPAVGQVLSREEMVRVVQCKIKPSTPVGFFLFTSDLNSAAIPTGSFACGGPPAGSSIPIPNTNTKYTAPSFFFFFLPFSFLTIFYFLYPLFWKLHKGYHSSDVYNSKQHNNFPQLC